MANGSIPSGSAPLYLGSFVSQRGAMAQKMTDRAIQLAEKEQTRQSQERAAMLKALSFDAVQGLGRQVQEEHLRELDNLQTEFSTRWIKNGRKLTDKDYLDLQRAKNAMAQKIAGYKKNVADYAYWTDAITTGKIQAHPDTLPALRKYYEEGRIGDDVTSLIRLMPNTAGYLNKFSDELNKLPAPQDYKFNPETEMMETVTKSNAEEVRRRLGALTAGDQYWQEMNTDPAVRRQSEADFERMVKSYEKFGQPKTPTDAQYRQYKKEQLPVKYQQYVDNYGWGDLNKIEMQELADAHDKVLGVLKHDPAMINSLRGQYLKGVGIVDSVELMPNGDINLFGAADKDNNRTQVTIPALVKGNRAQNITAMEQVLEILPGWTTTKLNKYSGYLNPDYEYNVESPEPPTAITELKNMLSIPGNEKSDYGEEARNDMVDWLEFIYPDEKIEVGSSWSKGKRPITVGDKSYNLAKEADRQKMMDDATAKVGINSISLQGAKTEKPAEDEAHAKSANADYSIEIPDSSRIASVHNNPGNLKYTGQKGATKGELREGTKDFYWANFDTPQAGFEALVDDIQMKKEGKTQGGSGLTGESTISDFVKKYAGENEEATESYIKFLEDNFDIKRDGKLKDYDARYLATAVARKESSTTVSQKSNESKPKTVVQDGVTYNYNETTGQYE